VSISTSVTDADTQSEGVQVAEGTTIPIRTSVVDDVQVREVELLANGDVVQTDVSFPFEFFAAAPIIEPGVSTVLAVTI
jgi:hypothetical protein